MKRRVISPDEHLRELNERLKEHSGYREGMEFRPYPEGSSGRAMSGYIITGPYELAGIYAQVAQSVCDDFDIEA